MLNGPRLNRRNQEFGSEDSAESINSGVIQKQGNLEKCCCEINSRKKKPEWNVVCL